jgi:polyhydroxybutyrate depolymerase
MSGGGRMTSQIGCDLADLVAAIAPVAGLRFPAPCVGSRPVPLVAFHGTADAVNPYDGGGQAYWVESVPSAELEWSAHDGCSTTPQTSMAAPGVTLTKYGGCAGGATVNLYTIDGAGHEWPGAAGQTMAVDANTVMWAFFSARRLAGAEP